VTERRRVTFYVDDVPYTRWLGATVEHAVIAHDQRVLGDIRDGRAWVVDARGDRVGLGGTLADGVRLYVRYVLNGDGRAASRPARD
jgi:hypothetical protein